MEKLIEELKNEHSVITALLDEVFNLGIGTRDGKEKLIKARDGLLAHLKKEDSNLYPVLLKEAENNTHLRSTLNSFASEMDNISKFAMDFFKKYSVNDIQDKNITVDFAGDFGKLFILLKTRIRREENIIFKEYLKLINK